MGHCQFAEHTGNQPFPIVNVSGLSAAAIRKLSGNAALLLSSMFLKGFVQGSRWILNLALRCLFGFVC